MYYVLLYYKVYLLKILRSICNKNSTGIESKQASRSIYNSKIKVRLIKSNLSLHSLYYAEACKKFVGLISASLHSGNIAPFEEMPQRWRAVGSTMSDLTGPRFEPQNSRSRDERVAVRPAGRLVRLLTNSNEVKIYSFRSLSLMPKLCS